VLVVQVHEVLEHLHEGRALVRLERRKDQALRGFNGGLDFPEHAAACRRDVQRFGAAVGEPAGAIDQPALFEAADDVADGRAIERNFIAKRGLVETRMGLDGDQRRILNRREVESLGLIQKQRRRNLLQPANEMAGHADKVTVVVGHRIAGSAGFAR
jgi:hypothetical protein